MSIIATKISMNKSEIFEQVELLTGPPTHVALILTVQENNMRTHELSDNLIGDFFKGLKLTGRQTGRTTGIRLKYYINKYEAGNFPHFSPLEYTYI